MTGFATPTDLSHQPSAAAATVEPGDTFAAPSPEAIEAHIARARLLRSQHLAHLIRSLFRVVMRRLRSPGTGLAGVLAGQHEALTETSRPNQQRGKSRDALRPGAN